MELAAQLDLLAQGPHFEDWGDFLVIAIMAVLWLAGALAKAIGGRKAPPPQHQQKASAQQQRRKQESWHERLVRKAEEMQRAAEAKGKQIEPQARSQTEATRPPGQPPGPPAGKVTVRPGPKGESVIVYERPASQAATERTHQAIRQRATRKAILSAGRRAARPSAPEPVTPTVRPGFEPIVEGMTSVMSDLPRPLEPADVSLDTARKSTGYQAGSVIDYSDPDALRKAILHYEILGKPLALRGPSEEATSL